MKSFLSSLAVIALLAGCARMHEPMGAAADNDKNVLTGGPIAGTTIQDLPDSVKSTLKQRAAEGEIASINKTTQNGQVVYEVKFTDPNKFPLITVSEDGRIVPSYQPESVMGEHK
jgi:hypothetical protein